MYVLCFAGSPADKAELEVGDEIQEVNGRNLEDCTHNEVITYIHKVGSTWNVPQLSKVI